jgi:hypothetical protein
MNLTQTLPVLCLSSATRPCDLCIIQAFTAPRPLPPHVLPPTPIHPTIALLALLSVASSHHYEPVDPHILLLTSSPVILPTPLPHSPLPHESLPSVLRPRLCVPSPAVVVSSATCSLTHWPGLIIRIISFTSCFGFRPCDPYALHLVELVFRLPIFQRVLQPVFFFFPFTSCRYPRSICASMSRFGNMITIRFDFLGTAICSVQCASLYLSLPVCVCKFILPCAFRLGTLHVTATSLP